MSNYEIESLRKNLRQAELKESIENKIKKSRCPLCNSELKCESRVGSRDYDRGYASASIRCVGCGTFGSDAKEEWSYWDSVGYSETDVIDKAWRQIEPYVRKGE